MKTGYSEQEWRERPLGSVLQLTKHEMAGPWEGLMAVEVEVEGREWV